MDPQLNDLRRWVLDAELDFHRTMGAYHRAVLAKKPQEELRIRAEMCLSKASSYETALRNLHSYVTTVESPEMVKAELLRNERNLCSLEIEKAAIPRLTVAHTNQAHNE
jgi:hypothetical protein